MSDKAIKPVQEDHFDVLLNDTLIPQSEIESIQITESGKTIRETLLSLGGTLGESINKLFDLNERIDEKIRNRKKEYLLIRLYENSNRNYEIIDKLKTYLINPQFSILFNKLIRILNDGTDNKAYIDKLSLVLKHIIDRGDFSKEFEDHKYILDQIERLSPQAIIILADYRNWPEFIIEAPYESDKQGFATSEWIDTFSPKYAAKRNIQFDYRLNNILRELDRNNLIRCQLLDQQGHSTFGSIQEAINSATCVVTGLGEEITAYITKRE